jgi:hypothetical protein
MTHAPNPKYAPPLKSAAEYEREIRQLTKQIELLAMRLLAAAPELFSDDLRQHAKKTGEDA